MDDVYRDYRIALRQDGRWIARITHVRGQLVHLEVNSSLAEGAEVCLVRARQRIDKYIDYLARGRSDDTA